MYVNLLLDFCQLKKPGNVFLKTFLPCIFSSEYFFDYVIPHICLAMYLFHPAACHPGSTTEFPSMPIWWQCLVTSVVPATYNALMAAHSKVGGSDTFGFRFSLCFINGSHGSVSSAPMVLISSQQFNNTKKCLFISENYV